MKKIVFVFAFLLTNSFQIDAQEGWIIKNPPAPGYDLYSVDFIDTTTGWVVGQDRYNNFNGVLIKTTDGGMSWTVQLSGIVEYIAEVCFTDLNIGYIVGEDGLIQKTNDGGNNWITQTSGTINLLRGVSFTDSNNGTAVGYGTILRTTNRGTNWTSQSSGITTTLLGISFTDLNNGTAVGGQGTILRTTNAGTTWTSQSSGTTYWLFDVSFTDANNGTVVGEYGTILHTTNGGVTFIEDEENNFPQPKDFLLQQNYPNPFNPSTKISWQSPVGSWQTLKVYDLLGREAATLVNEDKSAGSYEIDFQSTAGSHQLANGVYFYQLRVGDPSTSSGQSFVETKKMILLK